MFGGVWRGIGTALVCIIFADGVFLYGESAGSRGNGIGMGGRLGVVF
jgi:hypothetical protein